MKVLMFGWEFPPNISGGLGTACFGITRALREIGGVEVRFVIPGAAAGEDGRFVDIMALGELRACRREGAALLPLNPYGSALFDAVAAYASRVPALLESGVEFDLIHAHDWLTCEAAMVASRLSGKPLVLHVHSTEYDRAGACADPALVAIERRGMDAARVIVAVSEFTRELLVQRYGQARSKIVTVYNATGAARSRPQPAAAGRAPTACFLGRITYQKGPRYFIEAAARAAMAAPGMQFVMAGEGDQLAAMKQLARELGIGAQVFFPGFLRAHEVAHLMRHSDIYVMPSVSEPFGISALEAIAAGVPSILSAQSGVVELFDHVVKVQHSDVAAIGTAMARLARDPALRQHLREGAWRELEQVSWTRAARSLVQVYGSVLPARPVMHEPEVAAIW